MIKMDALLAIFYLMVKEYTVSHHWERWRFRIKTSKEVCANGDISSASQTSGQGV